MTREARLLTEEDLEGWGGRIGRDADVPLVIALRGDLGSGKTTLARAIARGAGVSGSIPSPTFNLLFRYTGRDGVEVVHLDLYRLRHEDEVWALGWAELPGDREIVLIEWPERAESLLPSSRWDVTLEETNDPELRAVSMLAVGDPMPIDPPEPDRSRTW